ncbi:DUF2163 domain-containing protein [Rhizobacter sp. P5_C2]
MRVASWEKSPGALAELLNSETELGCIDLYTFTLPGGLVLRWTGGDQPIALNGTTWSLGPGLRRSRTRMSVGIEVDSLDVTVYELPADLDDEERAMQLSGTPLLAYIARGGFEHARLELQRAFLPAAEMASLTPPIVGTLVWFTGRVATTKGDRTQQVLGIKSDTEQLDVMVPAEVYQPGCPNTLYDAACGVNRDAKTVTSAASSASDATRTRFSHGLAANLYPSGYFDLGVVRFLTGPNTGIGRTVKRHTTGGAGGAGSEITVLQPFPFPVAPGDSFAIYPGCDKTQSTCKAKFNNVIRFRGKPYVPAAETVM